MNFYPHGMINPGEIKVHHVVSPVDVSNWTNPKIREHVINALFSYFEQMAFIRDYVILGPVYLKSDELAQYVEQLNGVVPYLVELSAPMMRMNDWIECEPYEFIPQTDPTL